MPQCTNRTRAEQLLVCEAGKDGVPLLLAEITPMPFQSEAVGTNVTLQLPNLSSQNQRSSPDCHYWRSASSDFDGFVLPLGVHVTATGITMAFSDTETDAQWVDISARLEGKNTLLYRPSAAGGPRDFSRSHTERPATHFQTGYKSITQSRQVTCACSSTGTGTGTWYVVRVLVLVLVQVVVVVGSSL